jgi:hypothetical protein
VIHDRLLIYSFSPQGEIPEEAMRKKKGPGAKGEKEKALDGVESDDEGKTGREED